MSAGTQSRVLRGGWLHASLHSLLHPSLCCHSLPAGHVTNCTGGCWHPTDKTTALTCSEDGTLRVWDVVEVCQKTVIKPQVRGRGQTATWHGVSQRRCLCVLALRRGTERCPDRAAHLKAVLLALGPPAPVSAAKQAGARVSDELRLLSRWEADCGGHG